MRGGRPGPAPRSGMLRLLRSRAHSGGPPPYPMAQHGVSCEDLPDGLYRDMKGPSLGKVTEAFCRSGSVEMSRRLGSLLSAMDFQ